MRWSALVLAAFVPVLVVACDRGTSPAPSASPKTAPSAAATPVAAPEEAIKVVNPQYRTRTTVLDTTGKVQFNEEALYRINAPVTGRVIEVLGRPGDAVEPGKRLLVIDSPDLGSAKSDYAKAVSDAERSEAALELARELYEVKAVAQKEVRDAENNERKAVAERERAASRLFTLGIGRSQLKAIADRTDSTTRIVVPAPRSGIIVERNVNPGQVVAYGQSDTPPNLFTIADLSTMWVLADVYEPDVPKIHLGQPVTVTLPCCPDDRYQGRISYIADIVDKDTRTVKVRASVPNRGRTLKAEMFVRVNIATGSAKALAIPQAAVHREEGGMFVLVEAKPGEYERRPVKLGPDFDGQIEVLEGVTPNDRVVASGSILLKGSAK